MSKVSNCFQYSPLSNPLTKCHKGEQKKRKIKGSPRVGKGGGVAGDKRSMNYELVLNVTGMVVVLVLYWFWLMQHKLKMGGN